MRAFTLLLPLSALLALTACNGDQDGDGFGGDLDCDDEDATVYVGAVEVCDGKDNDCDGEIDNEASDASTFYTDADADGFGNPDAPVVACEAPANAVENDSDCDDGDGAVLEAGTWYADTDADGFGDADASVVQCEAPADHVADDQDCDDANAFIHPGADEYCNEVDDDCDSEVDEDDAVDASAWFTDGDGDGSGDPSSVTYACEQPAGAVENGDDCDDSLAVVQACCAPDAEDGDLIITADAEIIGGMYWFDTVEIQEGATLTGIGEHPVVIYANSVVIAGTLDVSGGDGADSYPTTPDGGDAGPGGGGGGGGGDCYEAGNGSGLGGFPNGVDAGEFESGGGDGGLPYGLVGPSAAVAGEHSCGNGGGGGGHFEQGGLGLTAFDGCEPVAPAGEGGEGYGSETLELGFHGGGGGAGGGANGGGGGGGGGALAIYANVIDVPGLIDASGGDGGGKGEGGCGSGAGGSGAGGTVWLHGDLVGVSGEIDAGPGTPAAVDLMVRLEGEGGVGAAGRVRISAAESSVTGLVTTGSYYEDRTQPECLWADDSIYDVQDGTLASGASAVVRDVVVTGVTSSGFYAQEAEGGAYSGVYVYTGSALDLGLLIGDRVSIWGETTEYNDLTEVLPDFVLWHGPGDALLAESLGGTELGDLEPWEGVFVLVNGATVDDPDLGFGEFSLIEGVVVDDQMYDWSADYTLSSGDTFTSIQGVLNYSFGAYKVEPREAGDLVGYVSVE